LLASINRPQVQAIVCRGGRPDLAGARLADILAPTLFLVGGHDSEREVVRFNESAMAEIRYCPFKEMKVLLELAI
jgi:putative phosphoribosyl transferase